MRLKALEEEAAKIKERAARVALLPMRREQIEPLDFGEVSDEFLLDMDNDEFIAHLLMLKTAKLDRDRIELEAEKARLAEEAHLAQVKKDAEVAERNRIEAAAKLDEERRIQAEAQKKYDAELAAQKLIDDAKAEADRVLREANDKIMQDLAQKEAAAREAEIRERQVKEEATKKEAQQKFLLWAKDCGWDGAAGGYKTVHGAGGIELWKLVGTYTE